MIRHPDRGRWADFICVVLLQAMSARNIKPSWRIKLLLSTYIHCLALGTNLCKQVYLSFFKLANDNLKYLLKNSCICRFVRCSPFIHSNTVIFCGWLKIFFGEIQTQSFEKIIDWEGKSESHVYSEGTRKRRKEQGIVCEAKDERTGVQSCLFLMEPSTEDIDSKLLTWQTVIWCPEQKSVVFGRFILLQSLSLSPHYILMSIQFTHSC